MTNFSKNPEWHAIQVRPRFERIVSIRLGQRGIEQYLPLRQVRRQPNGTSSIEVLLFPAYVFCKYDARTSSFWDIPGVLSMVQGADGINIIPEQQITDLRRVLSAGLRLQPWPFTSQGRIVMVEDGPLIGVTGILWETADKRFLVLSIQFIRRSIAVGIDRHSRISFRHVRSGLEIWEAKGMVAVVQPVR